jgi:hypothetical protein
MTQQHMSMDRAFQAVGLMTGLALMFVPLWLIYRFHVEHPLAGGARGAEAAVGVAVILRTTFRRLLRAGTSNLLRTSVGAFSRTSARTMTRRVVRTSSRLLLAVLALRSRDVGLDGTSETGGLAAPPRDAGREGVVSLLALLLGFVALALSFGLVASRAIASGTRDVALLSTAGGLSIFRLSLMAALPLLIYAASAFLVARGFGASTRIRTAVDGLLLQGYFAGAGSFLPMTTDIEYTADGRTQSQIAFWVLLILYALHLALRGLFLASGSEPALLLSSLVLVYCFVYSFPIPPLEGYWIWSASKLLWLVVWVPILTSFVVSMPGAILSVL